MRIHRLLPAILLAHTVSKVVAQTTCATALPIAPGTHAVAAITGTELPGVLCTITTGIADHAIWFTYTPVADATATVSTLLSAMDTRLHVYSGACEDLLCVAGDDDSGAGGSSVASFPAAAGVTYTIVFDDMWSSASFEFQLIETPPIDASINPISFSTYPLPPGLGAAYAVVDMDGDHLDDLVSVSSTSVTTAQQQPDATFLIQSVSFPAVANPPNAYIAAGDMDNNGRTDLLFGSGAATILLASADGSTFQEWSSETYLFVQRTNMADINNDGFLDGFYCHDIGANHYYFSDGQGGFTEASGELSVIGGNYGSIWIDFDNDGDVDMFNTKCGGGSIDELYRNDGDGQFTNVAPDMGLADTHNAWSSAWGDFDNDGDMDAFIGKSGSTFHKLMRNDGSVFTNITIGSGTEAALSSVDWRTHDLNNDGLLDILSQSEVLYNAGNMQFVLVSNTPVSGAIGDVNGDGSLDVVSGGIRLNNGNDNHWLVVSLVGAVSNRMGVGARVTVVTPQGQQIRDIMSGDGTKYMSTLNAHFGLGEVDAITQVEVRWPSGIVDVVNAPAVDGRLVVYEGLSTGLYPGSEMAACGFFPNPVHDRLFVRCSGPCAGAVRVCDLSGRQIIVSTGSVDGLDVSGLAKGTYVVSYQDGDARHHMTFMKE